MPYRSSISQLLIIYDVIPDWQFSIIAVVVIICVAFFSGKRIAHQSTVGRRPFFVKPDKYLFLLGLIALCSMLCEGAMFDWGVNYFEKVVQAKKSFVTIGYIAFITTMAGGRLIGDWFIQRFGAYRILIICGTLMAIGFSIAAAFPFLLTAAFGFLLIGMGDSVLVQVIYMLASKSKKMPASYALSSVTLIGYTGFLMGPSLIGNISEWLGMPAAFFILGGASLLIVILSLQVRKMG